MMKTTSSILSWTRLCVLWMGWQHAWVVALATSTPEAAWNHGTAGPPDAILGIAQAFRECTHPNKVNVCVGAYRDDQGQPWVLPVVKQAEQLLWQSTTDNKEYLPIEGDAVFVEKALEFAFGTDRTDTQGNEMVWAGVQTLSGTGACRIGGHFLATFHDNPHIYIPTPTWGNHYKIFQECGLTTHSYRYYNAQTNSLDFDGLLEDVQNAPDGSIFLFHACAHNPTGCDPTLAQWKILTQILIQKQHVIFFDSAYQGFASGDSIQDAAALRYVWKQAELPKVVLAQSFAKNFGLYGERCGTFSIKCRSTEEKERLLSQLRLIIRPMYSSPPRHGSSIVKTVLQDDTLTAQYYEECASMAQRIQTMRTQLVQALQNAGSKHDWSHVTQQIGMFAFTGMTASMCDALTSEYAIYLTRDGRISMAGLNPGNLEYVAQAIHAVTDGKSITG